MTKSSLSLNRSKVSVKGIRFPVEILECPKLTNFEVTKRPVGYAIPTFISGSATVLLDKLEIQGFADAPLGICEQKVISEVLERFALKTFTHKNKCTETSSGWACHVTPDLAVESAVLELIERDVALSSWQNGGPFYEVPESLWPKEVIDWKRMRPANIEFSELKIYLSKSDNGCCLSALLFNKKRNFVAGHATRTTLKESILSATAECMRAAHSALRFEYLSEVSSLHQDKQSLSTEPGAHSLAYAYTVSMPEVVQFITSTEAQIEQFWVSFQNSFKQLDYDNFDIKLFVIQNRYVARVKSQLLKEIYWGRKKNNLNNSYPHFVG